MESDDAQVGLVLTRREALALLGLSGAGLLTGCTASPGLDGKRKKGRCLPASCVPNRLKGRTSWMSGSTGAQVDVWQCDASGVHSDVTDPGFNSIGQKFLRSYQVTDACGLAQFTTIYPGWYQRRTVHIHFKIRADPSSAQSHEFVSQVYFDDALTDRVHMLAPYASRGERTTRNGGDGIFSGAGVSS